MKVTQVSILRVSGTRTEDGFPPGDRQAQSLDIYPEFARPGSGPASSRKTGGRSTSAHYVRVSCDEGVNGIFGPIDPQQVFVICQFLRGFLIGRDPLANELLLDQMLRLNRHGRSGMFVTGVSAVDCALWDLKGKLLGLPVYRLLGGPTRSDVPAYASMLGYSIDPDAAAEVAASFKAQGYPAQKWFFRHGPADGEEGKRRNVAMAAAVRQAVGLHYPLMFDAFMGWDVPYSVEMATALSEVNPTWLEEPVPPERVGGLAAIRERGGVPLATGEHVYTRWQVKELLAAGAVDYIQTDPDWCGGITELVKICSVASAFGVPTVAHGHSLLSALHVAAARSPATVPYVEYLVRHQEAKQFFHAPIYRPINGSLALPSLPGLGITFDDDKVEEMEATDG